MPFPTEANLKRGTPLKDLKEFPQTRVPSQSTKIPGNKPLSGETASCRIRIALTRDLGINK